MKVILKHNILLTLIGQIPVCTHYFQETKKSIFLFCFFIIISFCTTLSFAQYTYELDKTTRFEKMGADEGLSSMSVYCIHQDKYGFIWIGTQFGLNLYDGYGIKIFKADPTDPHSLLNDWITSIYEETDGAMWFCTNLGLSKYDRTTQTFSTYLPDTLDFDNPINIPDMVLADGEYMWVNVWKNDLIRFDKKTKEFQSFAKNSADPTKGIFGDNSEYIFLDGKGALWVCSNEQGGDFVLSKFNNENEEFTHYLNDPSDTESFAGKKVMSMIEDNGGMIWIATWGGGLLKVTKKEEGRYKQFLHDDKNPRSILSNHLNKIFEDSKENLWIGSTKGFSLLDKEKGQFTNYQVPNLTDFPNRSNPITDISEGLNGELWFTSRGGVFSFIPSKKLLTHYLKNPDNIYSLSDNFSRQIITDRTGQTWIVLPNSGINKTSRYSNVFKTILMQDNANNAFAGKTVDKFYIDTKGNFWFATTFKGEGLYRARINNRIEYENFESFFYNEGNPKSISGNRINVIYEDSDQFMWFGTWNGLNKYDYSTNNFTRFQFDPTDSTTISSNIVESIFEDSHGTFWVGTRNGLNIMDKVTGSFIRFLPDEGDSNANLNQDTRVIFEDSFGELWFGGNYLEKLNRKDTSFINYSPDPRNKSNVNKYGFRVIKEDKSTNLWISSTYGGLHKMERTTQKLTVLNENHGLPSNNIFAMEIDDKGFIWAASNQGLTRLNPHDYSVRTFDVSDGLVSREISDRGSYKDDEGWLYFGSNNGFNIFHPDSIQENKVIPPVYITSMNVAGEAKYFDKPLYEMVKIELPYNENDFSLDFVALNYINPQKNQYAFILEGYDEEWNHVGNRRTAFYTNISPGKYIFKVKGSNNDGYWNEEGTSIGLIIHPPFWKTWWAYILYFVIILSIFFGIIWFYLRRQRLLRDLEIKHIRAEQLEELDIEKNKFFSNISHEFRTPLTLILGPLDRFLTKLKNEEQKQELNLVRRNARRLQTLINQLLSLSKLESGKMNLRARPENIVKLTSLFLQSFHSMAEDRGIKLEFESDAKEYIVYIDTIKFEKVTNNLLSNAFKFTERGGKIKVSIFSPLKGEPKGVTIKFSDTGMGIQKEDLPHVFDRFYQVDETQMKTNLGTGIGLSLTKELIELHHGTIIAVSEPGMGTTFTIFLPMGKDHLSDEEILKTGKKDSEEDEDLLNDDYLFIQDAVTKPEIKTEVPEKKDFPLLLIVEDNEDMRNYIKSYLVDSFNIMEAENGMEGAEKAIEHVPDLIVSDLMMPKLDGNKMTTQLKTDERTSHIPIILLTAKASRESKLEGLETGADDFLTKPFDADELLVRVNNLINQRKRLREIFGKKLSYSASPDHTELKDSGITSMDEQFLRKAYDVVEKEMTDPEFGVSSFSTEMNLSRMQLHRKLKALTNQSATEFIKIVRLNKAAFLLKSKSATAAEIGYDVGFNSPTYFSTCFKEHFGKTPLEYTK